jgi:hypothetical protein
VTDARPVQTRLSVVQTRNADTLTLAQRLEDGDFVDRMWDYLLQQLPLRLKDIPPNEVDRIKQRIRHAERGERPYITPASAAQRASRDERIRAQFDGTNADEVARQEQCGRATLYRALKKKPGRQW